MVVVELLLSVLLGVSFSVGFADESYYCANVGVQLAGTVPTTSQGTFSLKVGEGYAKYNFKVDLSTSDTCDFTLYPMVGYHIHTFSYADPTSNPGTSCGYTGGHYDPGLACSAKSESANEYCTMLGRTSGDDYHYNCSTTADGRTQYMNPSGTCELGDLSGKFGVTKTSNGKVAASQVYTDYDPLYNVNFMKGTQNVTSGWTSIVFHCGDPAGTRIACGDFQLTDADDETCDFTSSEWSTVEACSNSDDNKKLSNTEFIVVMIVLSVGWALAIALCIYAAVGRSDPERHGLNSPMMRSAV
jgi:hypothetical protein